MISGRCAAMISVARRRNAAHARVQYGDAVRVQARQSKVIRFPVKIEGRIFSLRVGALHRGALSATATQCGARLGAARQSKDGPSEMRALFIERSASFFRFR